MFEMSIVSLKVYIKCILCYEISNVLLKVYIAEKFTNVYRTQKPS